MEREKKKRILIGFIVIFLIFFSTRLFSLSNFYPWLEIEYFHLNSDNTYSVLYYSNGENEGNDPARLNKFYSLSFCGYAYIVSYYSFIIITLFILVFYKLIENKMILIPLFITNIINSIGIGAFYYFANDELDNQRFRLFHEHSMAAKLIVLEGYIYAIYTTITMYAIFGLLLIGVLIKSTDIREYSHNKYHEGFWKSFITKTIGDRIENKLWDFKQTLAFWGTFQKRKKKGKKFNFVNISLVLLTI